MYQINTHKVVKVGAGTRFYDDHNFTYMYTTVIHVIMWPANHHYNTYI